MATNYTKQTWIDDNSSYPISAARMGVIETGIYDAHYKAAVRAKNSAVIAVATSTWTSLTFDGEDFDAQTMHSTSSNTGRLTAPVSGIYLVGANLQFAANTTGLRSVKLLQNGVTEIGANSKAAAASGTTYLNLVTTVYLVSGNYVEVQAYQTSGGSLNVAYEAGNSPIFFAALLTAY